MHFFPPQGPKRKKEKGKNAQYEYQKFLNELHSRTLKNFWNIVQEKQNKIDSNVTEKFTFTKNSIHYCSKKIKVVVSNQIIVRY